MRIFDIIRRGSRSLYSAKLRTILTSLAIAVGGFTLSLTLAASNGLRDYTSNLIKNNFDPAELIVGRDKEVSNTGAPSETPQEFDESIGSFQQGGGPNSSVQIKRITQEDVEYLKNKPYIEQIRESYQITIRYVTRQGQKKYTGSVLPYNPAQKPELKAGSLPDSSDLNKGEILLPDPYVSLLGFTSPEDALGKNVKLSIQESFSLDSIRAILGSLNSQTNLADLQVQTKPKEKLVEFKVIGITKKASTSIGFGVLPLNISNQDAKELYDFTAKGTSDYQKYLYVSARIKDGQDQSKIDAAQADLTKDGFYSISSKEIQRAITQFVDVLSIMVGVFGFITIIASVFGIVNTQYISVLERTREIGLMKSLGMSKRAVSRLFTVEATWIGFIGGVLGSLAGVAVGTLANPFITKKLDLGDGNHLLRFDILQIIGLIFALMLIATIAGLLPARKAAKLDPIEALRTE